MIAGADGSALVKQNEEEREPFAFSRVDSRPALQPTVYRPRGAEATTAAVREPDDRLPR
jgi:hypothetical protein